MKGKKVFIKSGENSILLNGVLEVQNGDVSYSMSAQRLFMAVEYYVENMASKSDEHSVFIGSVNTESFQNVSRK